MADKPYTKYRQKTRKLYLAKEGVVGFLLFQQKVIPIKLKGKLTTKDSGKFIQINTEADILECEVKDARFSLQTNKSLIYHKHFLKLGVVFLLATVVVIVAMMLSLKVSTR